MAKLVLSMQALLVFLSVLVALDDEIPLFRRGTLNAKALILGIGILLLLLASIPLEWKFYSPARKRRILETVPQQPRELGWWLAISIGAGIAEEMTYRGVMFVLLFELTGAWWPAALICALLFALLHAYHGVIGAVITGMFGLGMQWLVLMTGSLFLVMAVHASYDFLAGIIYVCLAKDIALPPPVMEQSAQRA